MHGAYCTHHQHRHRGGMSNKTPTPTELQIPATVTTKGRTIQPKLDRTDPVKSAVSESAVQYRYSTDSDLRKFPRTKGPGNESSRELSFPGNESSQERKVSGTKVPHRDYSFLGTKCLGHEKSRYRINH